MHPVKADTQESSQRFRLYISVFLVSSGLMLYELLLTRLFSVLIWYHFAFMAISLALLGLAVSGIFVYLSRRRFHADHLEGPFSFFTFLAALSIPVVLLLILWLNKSLALNQAQGLVWRLVKIFALAGIPLLFGGVSIALALYLRGKDAGRVYAADMAGAAFGAMSVVVLAGLLPVPQAILAAALLLSLVPLVLFESRSWIRPLMTIVACLCIAGTFVADRSLGLLQIAYAKGVEQNNLFEKWNAYSRVTVNEVPPSRGWAWSSRGRAHSVPDQFEIQIDGTDKTRITEFDGDLSEVEFLKYDITALPYYLTTPLQVLNIGAGGGKDVLTALLFQPEQVTAVELNPIVAEDIMLEEYEEFSGNLYRNPKVDLVVDEGRSFLSRTSQQFDIIQLTFTDTFAAAASGALALAENTLYTVESFESMIKHLTPTGLLTVTFMDRRGGVTPRGRLEALKGGTRIVGIAAAALERMGVAEPRKHLLVVKHAMDNKQFGLRPAIVNVMVSRTPLTPEVIERFSQLCREMGFTAALSGTEGTDSSMEKLADAQQRTAFLESQALDLSPSTDNRPFFLYQNKLGDARKLLFDFSMRPNFGNGMNILVSTLLISLVAVLLFIFAPLLLFAHRALKVKALPLMSWLAYFFCIGAGFMLIEITLLQQFVLLLSHPIYTLAVSLFALLVSTAMGSYLVTYLPPRWRERGGGLILLVTALLLLVYIGVYRWWIELFVGAHLFLRIFATLLVIMPVGIMLGMPMPLAIRRISRNNSGLVPWGWALNGAASVLGSGMAMGLSLHFGFRVTLLTGAAIYMVAAGLFTAGNKTLDTGKAT
jgi:hypothetical protein